VVLSGTRAATCAVYVHGLSSWLHLPQYVGVSNPASMLVSGLDYPRDWNQFLDWFADEAACLSYLEQLRWPEGFVCPRCGDASEPYRSSRSRFMCRVCRYQCTVTAGTVFDKTRTHP
jgi:hypothetical protein